MERVKNVVLAGLVLLSLFLSWQLMTYQPQYDYLTQDHYDQLEGLAESKEWQELFKPHLVVFHLAQEIRAAPPSTHAHQYVVRQMGQWELEPLKPVRADRRSEWEAALGQSEGIEFHFWQEQPLELVLRLFKVQDEDGVDWPLLEGESSMVTVRRILLFQDPRFENEVSLIMVQADGELLESRVANLSWRELNTLIKLGKEQDRYLSLGTDDEALQASAHYVPDGPIVMEEMHYRYKRIPIHHMLSYLFVDPSLVRRIEEKGNTILYLHGPRGVQVDRNYTTMSYFHPPLDQADDRQGQDTVDPVRAVQFVNQHKGWDREFLFDQLRITYGDQLVQFQFREYLGTYPVYSESGVRLSTLNIDLKLGRVVGYSRSLLQRGEMIESYTHELPSGAEVMDALKENGINLSQIRLFNLGYKQTVEGSLLKYEPCWVIELMDGKRWLITDVAHLGRNAA